MPIQLLASTACDGSRQFLALPSDCTHQQLRVRAEALPGLVVTQFLSGIADLLLDFAFCGHHFSIDEQFGEFWFFVTDPACPDPILLFVAEHFASFVRVPAA